MDAIRLRTMAWKSVIGFGKHADLSIRQIFDLKHTRYLRWVYYGMDGLSFNDEILKELHIICEHVDHRIQKPGTNLELHEIINSKITDYSKNRNPYNYNKQLMKTESRILEKKIKIRDGEKWSKSNMQRINQGR